MTRIFTGAAEIVKQYGGTVERFFGDEIMALFGVPAAHEDDPVRAIRSAMDIHSFVEKEIGPRFKYAVGWHLKMHSGINTSLLVTEEEYIDRDRYGLTGPTINLAKRLTSLASGGDIMVGPDTYRSTKDTFMFTEMGPTLFRGKSSPVDVYKVSAFREVSEEMACSRGVRADLIGREKEMSALLEAAEQLTKANGSVIALIGDAGTGKSRLTGGFRYRLNTKNIEWYEGHAYGYMQNTPYYPLVDLFTRSFRIKENDDAESIRHKLKFGLERLLGSGNNAVHYIGGLFSLNFPDAEVVSPERWKARLYDSVSQTLKALALQSCNVICFEDLQWADPSSTEMLRRLIPDLPGTTLLICTYRPQFRLLTEEEKSKFLNLQEIYLSDLNAKQTLQMLCSLSKTESVPVELIDFGHLKAAGNLFYLEEMINSLIEREILVCETGRWTIRRAITDADIPANIRGVLTARVDRLDQSLKRILQEASVIGRAFPHEVMKKINESDNNLDRHLSALERLDLIRLQKREPDLEYVFKHALTQEVVYNG